MYKLRHPSSPRPALRRPLVTVLLVFVLMQWVSLMHGMVHAGTGSETPLKFEQHSLLGKLATSHDDGGSLCQGLEHLGHGHAPLPTLAVLPLVPTQPVQVATPVRVASLTFVALYSARAPPSVLS